MSRLVAVLLLAMLTVAPAQASGQASAPNDASPPRQTDADAYTRYELLAPGSGKFRILYDVSATTPGARWYFNPIRRGSVASDERVMDRATGRPLRWEVVGGAVARAGGVRGADSTQEYIRVTLARPVPDSGEARILIDKTYTDAKSYFTDGDDLVFDRPLGIKRNSVVLPPGYELVSCNYPAQVLQQDDGRIAISFWNATPAEAPLVLRARRSSGVGTAGASSIAATRRGERAAQTREIVYFLRQPETHAFDLYHDYTETRPGVATYLNVVRAGSTVSGPSARNLDTGERLAHEVVKGDAIARARLDVNDVTPTTEVVVFRFPAVQAGGSTRLRMTETYTDSVRYRVVGEELVWDRAFGRPANAVVLPAGWVLTNSTIPATVSAMPDGRVRLDFVNARPDEIHVVITARRRAPSHDPAPASAPVSAPPSSPATEVPLHAEALGTYSWPIATRNPMAQAYFDQGLRLMYAYAQVDAQKSFEQSRRIDPQCAMCWWGEAWSLGSYLNGPMEPANAPRAHAATQQARSLAAQAPPVERALIEAIATRYAPAQPAGGRRGLDSAFAGAMAAVHARFPTHDDVATIHADALMLLEPRRGVWPLTKPSIPRIHGILAEVLRRNLRHPGACHAFIHATETTPRAGDAQPCADLLSAMIPAVSHINHMPSHTYNRVGRWGDATRANLVAVETDRRARRGAAFSIYPAHNLHMLLFSSAVDGQEHVAVQAAKDYVAIAGDDGYGLQALVLTRFGRFDSLLTLTTKPKHPILLGLWSFGRGLAHLRTGGTAGLDSARTHLARVDSLATHASPTQVLRQHQPARLLGIVGAILRGEILRVTGEPDAAIATFRTAVALERGLTYDEPEPLPFMSYEFLGAALLDGGRAQEAIDVYEAALAARPNSGWSLFGLEAALRRSGRAPEADVVRERWTAAWQRSSTVLRASRF